MAPGVLFSDLHVLAERTILEHLWAAGILMSGEGKDSNEEKVAGMDQASKANVLDAMQDSGLGAVFMPHGSFESHFWSAIIFFCSFTFSIAFRWKYTSGVLKKCMKYS